MLVLHGASASVRLTTSSTADISVIADYVDDDYTGTETFRANSQVTAFSSATTSTIVSATGSATVDRNIKRISARNKHASTANTLTIEKSLDNSNWFQVDVVTLAAGEKWVLDDNGVTFVYNSDGSVKVNSLPSGLFLGEFIHTDSSNHTTTANTHSIRFILVGGGGGGAGVAANNNNMAASGGGSAGGYTEHTVACSPSTAYAYVAGAAGAAAANNAAGGAGGNSNISIGGVIWTAQGGAGGSNMANGATNLQTSIATQTPANTSNNPIVALGGQSGGAGWRFNGQVGQSGDGGSSEMGAGGCGYHTNVNSAGQTVGQSGVNYGGGGAGGIGTNGNANGGAGANGCVIIQEFS